MMNLINQEPGGRRMPNKLSRGEIENLCILHAVGEQGCLSEALASRLGLSDGLNPAVVDVIQPLVARGWLVQHLDRIALSPAGSQWLQERLESRSASGPTLDA